MPKIKKGVFETDDDVITVCIYANCGKNKTKEEMCIDTENVFKNYEW